jgi:hypothetical protein
VRFYLETLHGTPPSAGSQNSKIAVCQAKRAARRCRPATFPEAKNADKITPSLMMMN